jgi:hypothetical protein
MARVKLIPTERLDPVLRDLTEQAVRHRQNPSIFQAMGHLPDAFKAYWNFYAPLRLEVCSTRSSRSWSGSRSPPSTTAPPERNRGPRRRCGKA